MTSILVVDDEAPIRELLAWVLRDLGYTVQEAIDGRQAIELASENPPDLVISDVMMPVMGGKELCRWVKTELEPPPPVILISSVGAHVARGSGADAFVHKPFDLDELEQTVRQYVH
ncbi:MAG: response regulator [Chloroflexota bacterium]